MQEQINAANGIAKAILLEAEARQKALNHISKALNEVFFFLNKLNFYIKKYLRKKVEMLLIY